MKKKYLFFFGFLSFLVVWTFLFLFISPQELISFLGIENGYLLLFLIASLGGFSSFTLGIFLTVLFTLVSSGLNLYLLAFVGGLGLCLGDSLFYLLGTKGRIILTARKQRWMEKLSLQIEKRHPFMIPFLIFVYIGFTPLPNDILMVSLGIVNYSYLPLIIGNMVAVLILVFLMRSGILLFS